VILPTLGQYPVADISHLVLQNFANSLSEQLTSVTVSQYLIAVRKVLSLAVSSGAIPSLPEFPKVKAKTNSRGPFTPTEYWQLLRASRAFCGQPAPDDVNSLRTRYGLRSSDHTVPPDLAWVIGFMVNSFIRPSDLKTLKHKHVEIVNNSHTYLRLTLPVTKSHDKPIVTLQPAVRIYRLLTAHHHRQDLANPNDYLFLPQHKDRAYAARVLAYYFNCVMAETGLKHGAHGQPRSLYSLRHSSITFRLLYGHGIDVLTLARNARTGVDMINRHYASTLTAEQNIGILQSRRPRAAKI
jgi:integrase